jgi:hypothetical protein
VDLDPGEKELLAYVLTLESGSYFICSCDRACLRAGFAVGLTDFFVSFEKLVNGTGQRAQLKEQYKKTWLETERTKLRLE